MTRTEAKEELHKWRLARISRWTYSVGESVWEIYAEDRVEVAWELSRRNLPAGGIITLTEVGAQIPIQLKRTLERLAK